MVAFLFLTAGTSRRGLSLTHLTPDKGLNECFEENRGSGDDPVLLGLARPRINAVKELRPYRRLSQHRKRQKYQLNHLLTNCSSICVGIEQLQPAPPTFAVRPTGCLVSRLYFCLDIEAVFHRLYSRFRLVSCPNI